MFLIPSSRGEPLLSTYCGLYLAHRTQMFLFKVGPLLEMRFCFLVSDFSGSQNLDLTQQQHFPPLFLPLDQIGNSHFFKTEKKKATSTKAVAR
jgi:hypothetical protein